jgi:hypothetical protein
MPPAKAVEAATVRAAASTSFFMLTSSYRMTPNVAEATACTQDIPRELS